MESLKQRSRRRGLRLLVSLDSYTAGRPPCYVLLQMEQVEVERRSGCYGGRPLGRRHPQHPCDGPWLQELRRRLEEKGAAAPCLDVDPKEVGIC